MLLKTAVIVFAAYHGGLDARTLGLVSTLAWALFMAPFFLLSAHGGYLGDHVDNRRLALWLKAADVLIAALAAWGFWRGDIPLLLGMVFAKGVTATLFSPIKYALVVDLLPPARRGAGYAVMEAGSMVAILGATYLGAMLGADPDPAKIGIVALAIAGASSITAFLYPPLPRDAGEAAPGFDPVRPSLLILRQAFANPAAFAAILALAWFWALGAVYLSNIAVLVRDTFQGDPAQVAAVLVIFTLGVSLGLGASPWLERRGLLSGRTGMAMACVIAAMAAGLLLLAVGVSIQLLVLFFVLAFASGVYSGHYSAILYQSAGADDKSRLFAANNITSSLAMVLALGLCAALFALEIPVATCLALFGVASVPVTALIVWLQRARALPAMP